MRDTVGTYEWYSRQLREAIKCCIEAALNSQVPYGSDANQLVQVQRGQLLDRELQHKIKELHAAAVAVRGEVDTRAREMWKQIMKDSRLIVCTLGALFKEDRILAKLLDGMIFDEVVLDEGSCISIVEVQMLLEVLKKILQP